jgi:UDP-2,3-diacylglucosamine hydrolase
VAAMRDIFIADAHLLNPQDANYRHLLDFLRSQRGEIGTLFLLGDIFEFWIGYRHCVFSPYVPLLETLRQLHEQGTQIVYAEGNHDFHLGPYFEKTLSCRILPDGGVVELGGERIYLEHGDLVNPKDTGYLLLRRVLRSRPLLWLAHLLPPDWAWVIARGASRVSQRKHHKKRSRLRLEELLKNHAQGHFQAGCRAVITGHFHSPLYRATPDGKVLIALGDWISQYSYAVFENGAFSLETFSPDNA